MTSVLPTGPIAYLFDALASLGQFKDKKANCFKTLTSREKEVLVLVAEGSTNPEIARKLKISRVTVQNHRASIRQKLNVTSEADYVKFALAFDLIEF